MDTLMVGFEKRTEIDTRIDLQNMQMKIGRQVFLPSLETCQQKIVQLKQYPHL